VPDTPRPDASRPDSLPPAATAPDAGVNALAHERLTFNAPLCNRRAEELLRRIPLDAGSRILDLGCGWAELLLRFVEAYDGTRGDGVDTSRRALDRGRALAERRGLAGRVTLHEADAARWAADAEPVDLAMAVGSSHAFGGTTPCLRALHRLVAGTGGRALLGDAFWAHPPGEQARAVFGDLPDLLHLTELAVDAGLHPLHVGSSTLAEWDDFESDWRAGLELSGNATARQISDERRREYLGEYRGVLGFGWLVLAAG